MSHIVFDLPDFAVNRGYIRSFSFEIEWIVSAYYDGDGVIVAHLVAPHATTDFYYSIPYWFWEADARSIQLKNLITDAVYWNPVYMDYRELPTTCFVRPRVNDGFWSVVIREPDYPIPANPVQLMLPALPDYWLPQAT